MSENEKRYEMSEVFRRIRKRDEQRRLAEVACLPKPTEADTLKWLEWVNGAE